MGGLWHSNAVGSLCLGHKTQKKKPKRSNFCTICWHSTSQYQQQRSALIYSCLACLCAEAVFSSCSSIRVVFAVGFALPISYGSCPSMETCKDATGFTLPFSRSESPSAEYSTSQGCPVA